ncbi:hypothetical protein CLI64_18430 [Nostoc sp. CENA543]|uniref:DUF2087 domain-containing protein n=1 Tax=Nostoc sp. CENA543 TaxID=1869241 RepID=UPI000CA3A6C0|nr:DUF2087 domain-containing protein [Nostoc sp. CENA543]AUT02204.1 hypothetical protein CLI64_18430 [Nostoc sp. CENA543]
MDTKQTVVDENSESWSSRILRNFLEKDNSDQILKEIPAQRKKRLVILQWLVEKFEVGVKYPESQVNATIKKYYPDYATLRRELIVNQLMQRQNGVYWRVAEG